MSSTTTNLGLKTWTRADKLLVNDINTNFQKIDALTSIIESGTITSSYSGGASGTATWRYRKYVDGTYDLDTTLEATLACNTASGSVYRHGYITLSIPGSLTSIYGYNIEVVSSSGIGWVHTNALTTSSVIFSQFSTTSESSANTKTFYISFKGLIG